MKSRLLFSISLMTCAIALSQPPKIIITTGESRFYGIDTTSGGTCLVNPYTTNPCFTPGAAESLSSVARYKDTLYYNDGAGNFFRLSGTSGSSCTALPLNDNTIALTADPDGNLVFVTLLDSLIRFNPHTYLRENLGEVNYSPSGDLIFYQQNLLMSSADEKIIDIDMTHPDQSRIFMDVRGLSIYGLANLSTVCQETNIIAFAYDEPADKTSVYEVDLYRKEIIKKLCTLSGSVKDAASEYESGGYGLSNILFPVNDTIGCIATGIALDAGPGYSSYRWDDNSSSQVRTVNVTGRYFVTVEKDGCTASDSINANLTTPPPLSFAGDTAICSSEPFQLKAKGDFASFQWQDSTDVYIHDITKSGTYSVTVTNGCGSNFSSINIKREDCSCTLYSPDAFTPNHDGINDNYRVIPRCLLNAHPHDYNFRIFNRNGQEVFRTRDPATGWSGTYGGNPMPLGTYAWEINYRNAEGGEQFTRKGTVQLIR